VTPDDPVSAVPDGPVSVDGTSAHDDREAHDQPVPEVRSVATDDHPDEQQRPSEPVGTQIDLLAGASSPTVGGASNGLARSAGSESWTPTAPEVAAPAASTSSEAASSEAAPAAPDAAPVVREGDTAGPNATGGDQADPQPADPDHPGARLVQDSPADAPRADAQPAQAQPADEAQAPRADAPVREW
jgi:hypothetical protein